MRKILCLLLALTMVISLVACGSDPTNVEDNNGGNDAEVNNGGEETPANDGDNDVDPASYTGPDWASIDAMDYDEQSDAIYERNLGVFADTYATAKEELDDTDKRLALMAIAEAKMLESGVFMPIYGDGGNFAMSRIAPRSITTTTWGIDEYRLYTAIVADQLIKSEDRDAITAAWKEAADAEAAEAAIKDYLTSHGYTLRDSYDNTFSDTPETWDVIATSYTSDSQYIAPTYAGLLEYDIKNVAQPALAESYEVSDDGLTYTFHIRQGVNWVDNQGSVIGEVTADDWVASMAHVADNNDALGYLMSADGGCGILNYDEFVNGEVTFDQVGVKALDTYTLQYTLTNKFPAFLTMFGYGCFAPLNRQFYASQGGTFSADGVEYTSGNYGTTPETIAYCGPFIITNYTAQNMLSYAPNPEFWNPDALNVHAINYYYNDGTDVLRTYNDAKAGTIDGAGFNANALELAKTEIPDGETQTYFDLYHYTTTNSATTYCGWFNLNRKGFANFDDPSVGVSPQTEEDRARTREAMNNQNFRLALATGFDRGAYNAVQVGEELKYASLKNSYTTGAFISTVGETTVDINGTSKTYPAGTAYGVIMQDQLDADGFPIKVWDPEADGGAGSGDGFDGWYNVDNARDFMNKAVAELAAVGVEVSADNPIYIDYPYGSFSETNTNAANAYKQTIEASLEGKVIVNLIAYEDRQTLQNSYYRNSTGAEANFDISTGSGWGPDYGDAQSFLDTIQAYGYMCKNLGIY